MKAKEIALNVPSGVLGANYFIKKIFRKLNVNTKTDIVLRYSNREHKDKQEITTW